jgi:NAD(P)-dependent dehydrogenase (short-subunit alcohol dehydrogenase family)
VKKVIAITTGFSDVDVVAKLGIMNSAPYAISKAALNMAVATFSAQYAKEGILFMGVAPGFVDVGHHTNGKSFFGIWKAPKRRMLTSYAATDEQKQAMGQLMVKFKSYAPDFTGPTTPEVSIGQMLSVIDGASVQAGNGGAFLSQFGNKQWL